MNYLKKTMEYLFVYGKGKRFCLFWLLLLPPCLITGFFFPATKYFDILFSFRTAEYATFGAFWLSSFNSTWWGMAGFAIAVILFVFGAAYVSGIITRHIRVGKLIFPNLWRTVNNNFFPALTLAMFFLLVIFIAHLLFVAVTYFWMQLASRILGLIMTVLFFILILVGMIYLLCSVTLWLPIMTFSGTYVFRALGIAFYKSRNYQRKFFVPVLLVLGIGLAISLAAHFIPVPLVRGILLTLVYSVTLTILVTLSFISYCEVEGVQREDLARLYFGR